MAELSRTWHQIHDQDDEAYKAGRIQEAISLYRQAADTAPDDPAPLSNLSAAYFESGDYRASLIASDQALALIQDNDERQKLYTRKIKSLIHLRDYDAADVIIQLLDDGNEKMTLLTTTSNAIARQSSHAADTGLTIRNRLITEIPRYKETSRNLPPDVPVGQGVPESLYDPELLNTGRDKISLLFAGVGDGRHLQKTFLSAGFDEAANEKCFHFTIVDHKPAVIARDFLVLLMIHEFSQILDDDEKKARSFLFPLFYYAYIAPIMPALLHDVLQVKIADAIAVLNQPELMPDFLDMPVEYRGEVLRIFKEWQEEVGAEYPTKRVRLEVVRQREQEIQSQLDMLKKHGRAKEDLKSAPVSCEKEKAFYEQFGILTMNWASHQMFYEEELQQAFTDFHPDDPEALNKEFLDVIDKNWKVNPTFIDLKWQRNRKNSHIHSLVVNHDPFEFGHNLLEAGARAIEKQGLLNIVSYWFNGVCHGFSRLRGRCKVEVWVGDVATVLEEIKAGTLGHRTVSAEVPINADGMSTGDHLRAELNEYPTAYDRIHMANVPDGIGGSLPIYPALPPAESS